MKMLKKHRENSLFIDGAFSPDLSYIEIQGNLIRITGFRDPIVRRIHNEKE